MAEIDGFYRNYHSSRYVGGRLVMRLHAAPDDMQLEALNDALAGDLLESGRIERCEILSEEDGEVAHLPRLRLHFNRKKVGLLRQLIDRVNQLTPAAAPPRDARRREIFASPLPDDQVDAEYEEAD